MHAIREKRISATQSSTTETRIVRQLELTSERDVKDGQKGDEAAELDVRNNGDNQGEDEDEEAIEEAAAASGERAEDSANLDEDGAEDLNLDEDEDVDESTDDELDARTVRTMRRGNIR